MLVVKSFCITIVVKVRGPAYIVCFDILNNLFKESVVHVMVSRSSLSTAISIEVSKRCHEVLITFYFLKRHNCSDEFSIIDGQFTVFIRLDIGK